MPELDYTNRPVPADESPETVIKVWTVSPDPSGDYDARIIRGWQDMLAYLRTATEQLLENAEEDELADGIEITVKLEEMTRQEYDEACEYI